jgi:hypothetical protein
VWGQVRCDRDEMSLDCIKYKFDRLKVILID